MCVHIHIYIECETEREIERDRYIYIPRRLGSRFGISDRDSDMYVSRLGYRIEIRIRISDMYVSGFEIRGSDLDTLQRGVQWIGGAVDLSSII